MSARHLLMPCEPTQFHHAKNTFHPDDLTYLPVPQMRHHGWQGSNMAWLAVLLLVFVGQPWLALMLAFLILILE